MIEFNKSIVVREFTHEYYVFLLHLIYDELVGL